MSEHVHALSNIYVIPAGPSMGTAVVKSAAANTYGAWTQLLAEAAQDIYITGFSLSVNNINSYLQIEIGIGAVVQEITVAIFNTKQLHQPTTTIARSGNFFILPFLKIPVGSRITARVAGSSSDADTISITLLVVPIANVTNPVLEIVITPNATVIADGANSATTYKTDLAESTDNHWKDAFWKFKTGALTGQVRKVTGYNGTTKFITCDAFTGTPAAGDTGDIINR
jgi:hypothetical protein